MNYRSVLFVDDNPGDRSLFRMAAEATGTNLTMAKDGREALNLLRRKNSPLPELVVLDLNMPDLSGLDCLRELRHDPGLKDLSVIVFASTIKPEEVACAEELRALAVLTKPIDADDFFLAVRSMLRRSSN